MAEGDFNTVILGHLGQVRPTGSKKYMIRGASNRYNMSGSREVRIGNGSKYAGAQTTGEIIGIVLDNTNYLEYHDVTSSVANLAITYLELN